MKELVIDELNVEIYAEEAGYDKRQYEIDLFAEEGRQHGTDQPRAERKQHGVGKLSAGELSEQQKAKNKLKIEHKKRPHHDRQYVVIAALGGILIRRCAARCRAAACGVFYSAEIVSRHGVIGIVIHSYFLSMF